MSDESAIDCLVRSAELMGKLKMDIAMDAALRLALPVMRRTAV